MIEYLKPLLVPGNGKESGIEAFSLRVVAQGEESVAVLVTAQGDNVPPALKEPLMVKGPWEEVDIQIPLVLMEYQTAAIEYTSNLASIQESIKADLEKEKAKVKKAPAKKAPAKKAKPKAKEKLEVVSHTLESKPAPESSDTIVVNKPAPASDGMDIDGL